VEVTAFPCALKPLGFLGKSPRILDDATEVLTGCSPTKADCVGRVGILAPVGSGRDIGVAFGLQSLFDFICMFVRKKQFSRKITGI